MAVQAVAHTRLPSAAAARAGAQAHVRVRSCTVRPSAHAATRHRAGACSSNWLLSSNCNGQRRDRKLKYSQFCRLNLTGPARSTLPPHRQPGTAGLEAAVLTGPLCTGSPMDRQELSHTQLCMGRQRCFKPRHPLHRAEGTCRWDLLPVTQERAEYSARWLCTSKRLHLNTQGLAHALAIPQTCSRDGFGSTARSTAQTAAFATQHSLAASGFRPHTIRSAHRGRQSSVVNSPLGSSPEPCTTRLRFTPSSYSSGEN